MSPRASNESTLSHRSERLSHRGERSEASERDFSERVPQRFIARPPKSKTEIAKTVASGYVGICALLIAIGLLLTKVFDGSRLLHWDEQYVRDLAAGRSRSVTRLSWFWSKLADGPTIIAVAIVLAIVLALFRFWHDVVWLLVMLAVELLSFLTVSYTIGRPRPEVKHLGSVPSTGSFPSGHIAATIVLYGTLAFILREHRAPFAARALAWTWVVVAALSVGWARVYRGMHHPLDVTCGVILGVLLVMVGVRAFAVNQAGHRRPARARLGAPSARAAL